MNISSSITLLVHLAGVLPYPHIPSCRIFANVVVFASSPIRHGLGSLPFFYPPSFTLIFTFFPDFSLHIWLSLKKAVKHRSQVNVALFIMT